MLACCAGAATVRCSRDTRPAEVLVRFAKRLIMGRIVSANHVLWRGTKVGWPSCRTVGSTWQQLCVCRVVIALFHHLTHRGGFRSLKHGAPLLHL